MILPIPGIRQNKGGWFGGRGAHFRAMRCSNCRPGSTHGAAASALQPDVNQPGEDEWEPKPNEARRWGEWVMVSGLNSTPTLPSSDIVMLEC
jgi:hypothetical protein